MKRLALLSLLIFLTECGAKMSAEIAGKGDYTSLPPVEAPAPIAAKPPVDGSHEELPVFGETPSDPNMMPCQYWNKLSYDGNGPAFRIVDSLQKRTEKVNNVNTTVLYGMHHIEELPQVRYVLSQEYADSLLPVTGAIKSAAAAKPACKEVVAAPGKTPLDPPDIEAFMAMARDQHDCGEVSDSEWTGLQLVYRLSKVNSASKKELLKIRNDRVVGEVEKQLPGAFNGVVAPLTKSKVIAEFLASASLSSLDPTILESLRPLERKVNLFQKGGWNSQRQDLNQSLRILDATSVNPEKLSLTERACRFAISQRTTSQMLSIKGVRGVPQVLGSGLLIPYPVEEVALYPKVDDIGRYNLVAERPWVLDQLSYPSARTDDMKDTEPFLQALRYYVAWGRYRSSEIWTPVGSIVSARGKAQTPSDLLALGMGFFGFTAKIMANEELIIGEDRSIHLKQDTTKNLAILGLLALEVQDTYSSLNRPTPFELALFGQDQINQFTDPYPVGVVAQFQLLTSGIIFEGLNRIHRGEGSDELKEVLRAIGRRIGNANLANLE